MVRNVFTTLALFLFLSLPFLVLAYKSSPDSDLICHTSNQADCYPRVFEPATDFQVVHGDQEIPSGLHVRVNLETGLKEAKLNDPNEDTSPNAIEVSTGGDGAVQAVLGKEPVNDGVPPQDYICGNANPLFRDTRATTPFGELLTPVKKMYQKAIKAVFPPTKRPRIIDGDTLLYTNAIEALQYDLPPSIILSHLDFLEDLAHDIYWGRTLGENAQAVQRLALMLNSSEPELVGKAALVLGNCVHNNKGGLQAVTSYSFSLSGVISETTSVYDAVLDRLQLSSRDPHGLSPAVYARLVYLLSSLLQSPALRDTFSESNHTIALASPAHFGREAIATTPEWNRPRAKIADLILDHFTDVDNFPSARLCKRPAENVMETRQKKSELNGEDDWVVVPSAADWAEFEVCRQAADTHELAMLKLWLGELSQALGDLQGVYVGVQDGGVVDHVREARRGVGAAYRGLRVEEFDYGID